MKQEVIKKRSERELIAAAEGLIRHPYSEYKIGMGSSIDSEKHLNIAVFNPNNNDAVIAAYKHFTGLGMVAKEPIGNEMKYLYFFKIEGELFPIVTF